MVWFNLNGNIQIRKTKKSDSSDWCGVRYRRHKIAFKKLRFDYVNEFGNYTTESYRGTFNAFVSSKIPMLKKNKGEDTDCEICSKPGAPPIKVRF